MVRDFIAALDFRHPWEFAKQYYYHYPKVAIGVWPPLFYGALGIWFLIFGASRVAAISFIAIVAATTASLIYFVGRRLLGRWAGVLAAVLFIASPLVQESSGRVMTEHLSTLGMLVSTLCFAQFARTEQIGDGLAFGTVAAAAILTHGNAWALGLVPGITLALTDRWYLLRQPKFWLAAVPVLVACVPWYLFTLGMPSGIWDRGAPPWVKAAGYTRCIYLGTGLIVLVFAFIGVTETIIRVKPRKEVAPEWAALAGLAIATFVLYCAVPVPIDSRYMVAVLPSFVLFSAAGVNAIAVRLGTCLSVSTIRVGLALIFIAAFCAERVALPLHLRNDGYAALVGDVMARVANVPQVWLISSGSTGEGSLVAAVALQEARPNSYVLRGKTILAGGDWFWRNTQDRFDTPVKLAALLDDFPVTIIVIDDRVPPNQHRPYQDRLKEVVTSEGDRWALIRSYAQRQDGIFFANSLHVYARNPVASLTIAAPAIRLDRVRNLMVRDLLR
jgi:hypothetical protein